MARATVLPLALPLGVAIATDHVPCIAAEDTPAPVRGRAQAPAHRNAARELRAMAVAGQP